MAKDTLVFAIIDGSKKDRVYNLAKEVLTEIGARMNIKTELRSLPPLRAEALFKSGAIDAELARVASYHKRVPSAIRVNEPIISAPLYAYAKSDDFTIKGWQSLTPYKIVTVRGYVFAETHLARHDNYFVDSHEVAFRFIETGRADLFICSGIIAQRVLKSKEFEHSLVRKLVPRVAMSHSYTFFAKGLKKEALAFEKALLEIKENGIYDKLFHKIKVLGW